MLNLLHGFEWTVNDIEDKNNQSRSRVSMLPYQLESNAVLQILLSFIILVSELICEFLGYCQS